MRLKIPRRLAALAMSAVMALGLLSTTAFAEDTSQLIDPGRTGSITIHKYVEDSYLDTAEALTQAEIAEYIQSHPDGLTPLAGVTFRYLKVADVVQYTKRAENADIVKLGYAVTDEAADFLGLDAADIDATVDGAPCYGAKALDEALNRKTATQTEEFVSSQNAEYTAATDDSGTTSVEGLPLGLYLLCEYSYPATAIADTGHCAPFLVSLPSTDLTADGTYCWDYSVDVVPKNMISTLHNDKVILGTGGNETREYDAEIGESVPFLIRSDLPNAIGKLQTYKVMDTLSEGLTYDSGSFTAYAVADDGTRTPLKDGEQFVFSASAADHTLTWDFNCSSLADQEGWRAYDSVEIYYTAHLNKHAVVGAPGNPNDLKTVYSRYTNSDSELTDTLVPNESPRLYTYAIQIHKIAGDTNTGLAGVEFELQAADGSKLNVSELTPGVPGRYYLDADGTAALTTDQEGNIYIKGVEAGTYYLKETATNNTLYSLLTGRVEISISSNENAYTPDANGTYAPADPEKIYSTDSVPFINYFALPLASGLKETVASGTFVSFGVSTVTAQPDGGAVEMYRADKLTWSSNYTMGDSGVVKLEITNNRIPLPKTGGDGDIWALVIGSCVICAGAVLFGVSFLGKRRRHHSAEE